MPLPDKSIARAAVLAFSALCDGAVAGAPVLSFPLDCVPGRSCFIQQYADHDPGPAAKDYRCGARVYDGHDGTDIRLPSVAAQQRGVAVLAAASGTVKAVRDGEVDRLAASPEGRAAVRGRECGNGLVIDHADGWQTQYCHMARGSILVRPGQAVTAGQRLGLVGLSGDTEFPHLHISVRQAGAGGARTVDPFAPDLAPGQCRMAASGPSLWSASASAALAYRATEILNAGFGDAAITMDAIEAERTGTPTRATPLVFFGRVIGLQSGDRMTVRLADPDGAELARNSVTVDTAKAQYMLFAGKAPPPGGWPQGRYTGEVAVERADRVIVERAVPFAL